MNTAPSKSQFDLTSLPLMDLPSLRISYPPIDVDYVDQPVFAFRIDTGENDDELPIHWHRKGQLVVAARGSVMCRVPHGLWVVPSSGAGWIPAGVPHSNCVSGNGRVFCIFIDPEAARLPDTCCTFTISPLVREIIYHLAELPPLYPLEGPTSRLAKVLLDELMQATTGHHHLPMSTDPRLRHIAESLLVNPADRSTISDWAARIAMSERSLARLVVRQTGMTFGRWRRQLHILMALRSLSAGVPVQTISRDLGYESPSAFITMFRKALGKSPGQYFVDRMMS